MRAASVELKQAWTLGRALWKRYASLWSVMAGRVPHAILSSVYCQCIGTPSCGGPPSPAPDPGLFPTVAMACFCSVSRKPAEFFGSVVAMTFSPRLHRFVFRLTGTVMWWWCGLRCCVLLSLPSFTAPLFTWCAEAVRSRQTHIIQSCFSSISLAQVCADLGLPHSEGAACTSLVFPLRSRCCLHCICSLSVASLFLLCALADCDAQGWSPHPTVAGFYCPAKGAAGPSTTPVAELQVLQTLTDFVLAIERKPLSSEPAQ